MPLLRLLAALALVTNALLLLLPSGGISRTAVLCAGLTGALLCMEAISAVAAFDPVLPEPSSVLISTGLDAEVIRHALP